MPINNMYIALDKLIIDPSVSNVADTSGTADSTVVEDTGARKEQKDKTAVMICFRRSEKRL